MNSSPTSPQSHDSAKIKKVMTKSPFAAEEIDRALFSSPQDVTHYTSPNRQSATVSPTSPSFQPPQHQETYTTAMEIGFSNPRISVYSPMAASVLEYLDRTTPRFCKSETGAKLLDEAIKERYPEIWDTIFSKATTEQKWIELDRKRRKTRLQR
jgi:hypothetical protein